MNYSDKLKSPTWQKKRLRIFERDGFVCQRCYDPENKKQLNVHHISYSGNPWEISDDLLITLCEDCHLREKNELQISKSALIKKLKSIGFMSHHFWSLARVFENAKIGDSYYNHDVLLVLKMVMDNSDIFNKLLEDYKEQESIDRDVFAKSILG